MTEPITVPATEAEVTSPLAGLNICIMGPSGSGKTHALGTLVDSGIEVFYLGLESGIESLFGYYTDRNLPIPDNLHYNIIEAPTASFNEFKAAMVQVNTLSLDVLAKMTDSNRSKHNQFIKMVEVLNNFVDQRTGISFGPVDKWGTDRALAIDGMTGMCKASMALVIGGKPLRGPGDWQLAQDNVEKILSMLTNNCRCHFVLLAHVEREVDPVLGGIKIMISALGKALAPKLPAMFSDVILSAREGTAWFWDTASALADVKTRNLPIISKNAPDFRTILTKWKTRGGLIEKTKT